MCKPDAVQRGLVGEIIARWEKRGYKLCAIKVVQPDKKLASGMAPGCLSFVCVCLEGVGVMWEWLLLTLNRTEFLRGRGLSLWTPTTSRSRHSLAMGSPSHQPTTPTCPAVRSSLVSSTTCRRLAPSSRWSGRVRRRPSAL